MQALTYAATPQAGPGFTPPQQTPGMPGQMPGQMQGQMQGQVPGQMPGQMPGQRPGQMQGQMPSPAPGPAASMQQQGPQGHGPVSVQPSVAQLMAQQRPAAQPQQAAAATAAAPAASAAAPVSDSWTEHTAPDGRKYYYNKATKQSSWERPASLAAAPTVFASPVTQTCYAHTEGCTVVLHTVCTLQCFCVHTIDI